MNFYEKRDKAWAMLQADPTVNDEKIIEFGRVWGEKTRQYEAMFIKNEVGKAFMADVGQHPTKEHFPEPKTNPADDPAKAKRREEFMKQFDKPLDRERDREFER